MKPRIMFRNKQWWCFSTTLSAVGRGPTICAAYKAWYNHLLLKAEMGLL